MRCEYALTAYGCTQIKYHALQMFSGVRVYQLDSVRKLFPFDNKLC